jgi:hypothetical protein
MGYDPNWKTKHKKSNTTMKQLLDVMKNPSGFDSLANYDGSLPDAKWLVVLTRSRDSDVLTESNWICALERLGGESNDVEVFRFGHWACGWWEALCVANGSPAEAEGQSITDDIEAYPVLDEEAFSEAEMEAANEVWSNCYDNKDRIRYIREHRNQFDFHDFNDLMSNVRGKWFSGYASELIY